MSLDEFIPTIGIEWEFLDPTWRIIPCSKWLVIMVILSPLTGVVGPLPNGRTLWLINGGDPNYLRYLG